MLLELGRDRHPSVQVLESIARVLQLDANHAGARFHLALIALRDGLEAQMTAQENLLFPAILQGEVAGWAGHVRTVIDQHDEIGTILQRIEHVTHSMQLPIGACGSWTALYTGLRKLCADVVAHFYVEQSLLLPRAVAA